MTKQEQAEAIMKFIRREAAELPIYLGSRNRMLEGLLVENAMVRVAKFAIDTAGGKDLNAKTQRGQDAKEAA